MRLTFVAGCPRSGSTWLANALAKATHATLVHEPFNWKHHPDREGYHLKYLPAGASDPRFVQIIAQSIREARPERWWLKALAGRDRYVLKDVHALPTIEYLWANFHPATIVLLRHPCAVAGSWARLKFDPGKSLAAMLAQDDLVRDHLRPLVGHMTRPDDFYGRVGAYWGAIYHVLLSIASRHPQWQVVRHEDLCTDPVDRVGALVRRLGMTMSAQGRAFLVENNHEPESGSSPYSLSRQGGKEADKWKHELQPEDAERVLRAAEPFGVFAAHYAEGPGAPPVTGALPGSPGRSTPAASN